MSAAAANAIPIPWWKEPTKDQWLAWVAAWLGWTLDSFDFTIFLLLMVPIAKDWTCPGFVESCGLGISIAVGVSSCLQFRDILWFDPWRSHSSVPTRTMVRPSRAAAVKDGPILGPPEGRVLDGRERGGRLACVGIDLQTLMPALIVDR